MKLIIVIPKFEKGGAERVLSNLSQNWIKKNNIKLIIFDKSNFSYPFHGEVINLNLPALNGNFFKLFQFIRRLIQLSKIFKKENPDRIISFMESANFLSIFAAFFSLNLNRLIISVHTDLRLML